MKRSLLFLIALLMAGAVLLAGCVIRTDGEESNIKLYNPSGDLDSLPGEFTARKGETFSFSLEGNPTTGYTWEINIEDETILHFDNETYTTHDPEADGSGGVGTYTFSALKKGQTTMTLEYAQHWEGGEMDKTKTVTITVE